MSDKNVQIINGCKVIQNGNKTTFIPIEKPKVEQKNDNRSWFGKLIDWFSTSKVTPYVKVRNLADPFGDLHIDGGGKKAAEIGIKIKF